MPRTASHTACHSRGPTAAAPGTCQGSKAHETISLVSPICLLLMMNTLAITSTAVSAKGLIIVHASTAAMKQQKRQQQQARSQPSRLINDDVINDDENDFFELSNKQITSNVGSADYIDDDGDSNDDSEHDDDDNDDIYTDGVNDNDNDEQKKNLKIEKKKRKFEEMKEKKRSNSSEGGAISSSSGDSGKRGDKVMTVDEMYQVFVNNQPVDMVTVNNDNILSKANFYTPNSNAINVAAPLGKNTVNDSGNTTKSAGDDSVKAIMNAIATGMPAYKQILRGESKQNSGEGDEEFGSPFVVILCAGARRAADVINGISAVLKVKVAKLFAKHFKVTEQMAILSKQSFPVAVGTPNRVFKLAELGALKFTKTQLVLIDMARDQKSFDVFSLMDVKKDLYELVNSKYIMQIKRQVKVAMVSSLVTYSNAEAFAISSAKTINKDKSTKSNKPRGNTYSNSSSNSIGSQSKGKGNWAYKKYLNK